MLCSSLSYQFTSSEGMNCETPLRCFVGIELPFVVPEFDGRSTSTLPPQWTAGDIAANAILTSDSPHHVTIFNDENTAATLFEETCIQKFQLPLPDSPNTGPSPPSFDDPRLYYSTSLANDLILEIRHERRIRRKRRRSTGEVLSEECIGQTESRQWIGVVSRRCELGRPGDFVFRPLDAQSTSRAVSSEGDVFAAEGYIGPRCATSFEYNFSVGKNVTKREIQRIRQLSSDGEVLLAGVVDAQQKHRVPDVIVYSSADLSQVKPTDEMTRFLEFARDCPEIEVARELLSKCPVWECRELLEAMRQSARCGSKFFNIRVVKCLTYVIQNGPFQRLRVRFGFDPSKEVANALLQRVTLKIARRLPLGIAIRDAHRSPFINEVIGEILADEGSRHAGLDMAHVFETHRGVVDVRPLRGFRSICALTVAEGNLFRVVQLIDIYDDPLMKQICDQPIDTFDPHERGFYTEESIARIGAAFKEGVSRLLREDILPKLSLRGQSAIGDGLESPDGEESPSDDDEEAEDASDNDDVGVDSGVDDGEGNDDSDTLFQDE